MGLDAEHSWAGHDEGMRGEEVMRKGMSSKESLQSKLCKCMH